MLSKITLIAGLLSAVIANSQVVFDKDWNLYLLGVDNKDLNAGTKADWSASKKFTTISGGDRPSFDTMNPQCWLSQYFNGAYCLNADSDNSNNMYILDFKEKKWSSLPTTLTEDDKPDVNNLKAVLDHDTNTWYGLSDGKLYSLEVGEDLIPDDELKWKEVGEPPFETDNYEPTIGLASNHLHFIDVPNAKNGEANLFVIHYAYFQPDIQNYGDWEQEHGQTASVFKKDNEWQTKFWFIPDSGKNSYLIDVETNTTTTFDGPVVKDAKASYASSENTLVQLTSTNKLYFLDFDGDDKSEWVEVENSALPLPVNNTENNESNSSSMPVQSTSLKTLNWLAIVTLLSVFVII